MASWLIVIVGAIALVVLLAIALIVIASTRKKSLADKRTQAEELRTQAAGDAAGLPDARARAEQAMVKAEHMRHEAELAEQESAVARTELEQERARHEEQIRAADRLDPDVDHKAKDYSPEVGEPAGPSMIPTDPALAASTDSQPTPASPTSDPDTVLDSDDEDHPDSTHRT